jgi:hypothetical protein
MGGLSPMGERKDAIPIMRRRQLKIRAAIAAFTLLAVVVYLLMAGAPAADAASQWEAGTSTQPHLSAT